MKVEKREVSPILQMLRYVLIWKHQVNPLRFQDEISKRTQPQPNLPGGPHSKLSANYYFSRDSRRLVPRPNVLYEGGAVPRLEAGEEQGGSSKKHAVCRTPGNSHSWDK